MNILENQIELRKWKININNNRIELKKGNITDMIHFMDIESCIWTRKPFFNKNFLKISVILIFAFGIGLIFIAIYFIFNSNGLDIQMKNKNYVIIHTKETLTRLQDEINKYRIRHGKMDAIEIDKTIEKGDEIISDLVEHYQKNVEKRSRYKDIKACSRCGSIDLKSVSVSDGGIPGVFDIQGQLVCKNCGLIGMPLPFSNIEEYKKYLKGLKFKIK